MCINNLVCVRLPVCCVHTRGLMCMCGCAVGSYRKVAEALTRFENHHYESQAINSLFLKRCVPASLHPFRATAAVCLCDVSLTR